MILFYFKASDYEVTQFFFPKLNPKIYYFFPYKFTNIELPFDIKAAGW